MMVATGMGGGIMVPTAGPADLSDVFKPTAAANIDSAKPQTTIHLFIEPSGTGFPSAGILLRFSASQEGKLLECAVKVHTPTSLWS